MSFKSYRAQSLRPNEQLPIHLECKLEKNKGALELKIFLQNFGQEKLSILSSQLIKVRANHGSVDVKTFNLQYYSENSAYPSPITKVPNEIALAPHEAFEAFVQLDVPNFIPGESEAPKEINISLHIPKFDSQEFICL